MKTNSKLPYIICLCLFSVALISTLLIRHFGNYAIRLDAGDAFSIDSHNSAIISGKINVNSASCEELILLPGIGNALAQRIIDYRCEHGAFLTKEELLNVKGIGSVKLDAISQYITIGGTS